MPGSIIFKPIEANLTHDTGLFSKMNPYCAFTAGDKVFNSEASIAKGKTPQWNGSVKVFIDGESEVLVEVMDKDRLLTEDRIGSFKIDLNEVKATGHLNRWFSLSYNDKPAGEILMDCTFESANAKVDEAIIEKAQIDLLIKEEVTKPIVEKDAIVTEVVLPEEQRRTYVEQIQTVEPHTFIKEVDVVETHPVKKTIEVTEPQKILKEVQYTEIVPVKKTIETLEPTVVHRQVEVMEPRVVAKTIYVTENVPVMKDIETVEYVPVTREIESMEPQTFTKNIEVIEQMPTTKVVNVTELVNVKKEVEMVEPVIVTQTITKEIVPEVIIAAEITKTVGPASVIGVEAVAKKDILVKTTVVEPEVLVEKKEVIVAEIME